MTDIIKIIGYCLHCREKKEMTKAEKVTMKNGRAAARGICPECGGKMFKILSKQEQ